MVKRWIAGFLAAIMLFGFIPIEAFAQDAEEKTSVNTGDVTVEGTNGFGALLSEEITESQEEAASESEDYEDGYTVTDLLVAGSTATVTYDSLEDAVLVVALYSEDGMQLLTSAMTQVTPEDTEAAVTFEGDMPEYFLASAYLVDIYDLSPLCPAYDTPLYTREMQELLASTVEDYDAGRVLNLDDSNSTNFAVYAEDTVVIEEQAGVNTVASVNDDTATYVIENADESITGLQAGDVFAYPYGENDILIVKVASITVDGTTATITGEKLEMEEVFQAVKIDGTSGTADITVDDSTAGEGITYAGLEGNAGSEVRTFAIQGGDTTTASHKFEIQIKAKGSSDQTSAALAVSGSLNIEMGVSVKYYISAKNKYVEFKVTPSATFALTVNESITLSDKLGYLAVCPVPGVYVGFEPEIQLKFNVKTSLNVTLDSTIGFKYDTDSGVQNISKSPDIDVKITIDGTIFVGIDFCPKVAILDDSISKIEVNMLVGAEIKASTSGYAYEAYEKDSDTYHKCRECIAMTIQFKASLGGTLQFLSQDWLTVKITIGEWKVPLGEMYYSVDNDEFDLGKCPNLTYRVTIEVMDKDQNPIPNQDVTVSTLDEPLVTNENGVAVFYSRAETIKVRAEKDGCFNADVVRINSATKIALHLTRTTSSAGGSGGSDDTDDWRDGIDFGGILGTVESEEITDRGTIVDSGTCGENVSWKLYDDGTLYIYGTGAMKNYSRVGAVPWYNSRSGITSAVIGDGVTSIGDYAFNGCSGMTSVNIPVGVTSIGERAFGGCSGMTSVNIPVGVTSISAYAFRDCSSLTGITIPGSVTDIGNDAFIRCNNMKEIRVSEENKNYSSDEFGILYDKEQSTLIECPGGFEGSYIIPDSVTSIGTHAFCDCSSLTGITIPGSVTDIGRWAFCDCDNMKEIRVSEENKNYSSDEFGILYDKEQSTLIQCPGGFEGSYIISDSVTSIGEYAFYRCWSLTSITIVNGVTSIGNCAFFDCSSLPSITIPESVTSIGEYAFQYCSSLTNITIADGVTSIGKYAFSNCSSLTNTTIPDSVTSIGECAFNDCSSLTDVYYTGTEDQWNAISIESGNTCLTDATIHYNSTGPDQSDDSISAENDVLAIVNGEPGEVYDPISTENDALANQEKAEEIAYEAAPEPDAEPIPDSTPEPVPEPESIPEETEPLIEDSASQEAPTVDAIYSGEYDTERTDTYTLKTASFTGLVPAEQYVLLALVSLEAENPLAPDNLLYIDQAEASADGTLRFQYVQQRSTDTSYVVACGASNRNLSDAVITFPIMVASETLQAVNPTVVYDGKTLTEGSDYTIVGTVSFSEPGTYTCGIRGIHNYTGLVTCTYCVGEGVVDSGTCGDTLTWELNHNGTLTISGTGDMTDYDQGAAPWYSYTDQIFTIVVENGVASIGDNAFWECGKVTDVTLPDDTLISIGGAAFGCCTSLKAIQIPDSVIGMDSYAFLNSGLTEISLSANLQQIGLAPFGACPDLKKIDVDDGNTHGIYDIDGVLFVHGDFGALSDGRVVSDVLWTLPGGRSGSVYRIPDGVNATFPLCFVGCVNLTGIEFPGDVVVIETDSFLMCDNLKELRFEGNAPQISDNAFEGLTATAYYPAGDETWTEDIMQNYGGTITWVAYEASAEPTVTYTSASISLAGDIGVNYYVQLSDDIVADAGSYMQFTVAGQTQTIPLSEAITSTDEDGVTTYRFTCKVAAKQMTDTILGQMYTSSGPVGESRTYSVKAYCDAAIPYFGQYESYASLIDLMKAMLNYGAYSQIQFDYYTQNLANAGLEDTSLPELTAEDLAAYAHGATGSEDGISISSVSLLLESTTTIRFYFKLDGTKSIEEYTFYVDGVEVEPVFYEDNTYYVDKGNVAAKDLDKMAVVTVGGLTVQYCGLSYVRQVAVLYPDSYSESLINVAKALYAYNQCANTYFG